MTEKDTYYFAHDYNARSNKHIKKLLYKHGMVGYGIWWSLVEDLYNNANALPLEYESIAHDLRVHYDTVKSVINDFELFVIDGDKFSSDNVQRRLDERNKKSIKAKESAFARWNNANALRTKSDSNAIKERKGNKRKGKEIYIPTLDEVQNYFYDNGYTKEIGKKAFDYYNIANWKDSKGKEVLNWKQKMQSVWFKDENKIPKRANNGVVL